MSRGWTYHSGDWWITCDSCSRQVLASESRERWDGFRVCKEDWEPRHPQDFIRTRLDKIVVPFTRPEPPDVFTYIPYIVLYVTDNYILDQENYILENEP